MIKILIADDHGLIREGLKKIVEDVADMVVEGEACNFTELLALIRNKNCDVFMMDLSMPNGNVLDSLKQIQVFSPKLPILIVSVHAEDQFAVRLLKAGASGYLNKECEPEELIKAIRELYSGKKCVSKTLAGQAAYERSAFA